MICVYRQSAVRSLWIQIAGIQRKRKMLSESESVKEGKKERARERERYRVARRE